MSALDLMPHYCEIFGPLLSVDSSWSVVNGSSPAQEVLLVDLPTKCSPLIPPPVDYQGRPHRLLVRIPRRRNARNSYSFKKSRDPMGRHGCPYHILILSSLDINHPIRRSRYSQVFYVITGAYHGCH